MEDKCNPTIDENQYGYVYRLTHIESGKTYVGMHKIYPGEAWRFYMGSGSILARYKARYGANAFSKELLGYAESFSALKALESEFITKERASGGADLNLDECEMGTRHYFKALGIDDSELLHLYFDEKLSLEAIVRHYDYTFTRNQLSLHLKKIKGFQDRQISSGDFTFETKLVRDSKTGMMVERTIVKRRIIQAECPDCHRRIRREQIKRHQGSRACQRAAFDGGAPVCAVEGCNKVLAKLTSTYCKAHYGSAIGARNARNFDGVDRKEAGAIGSHKRHHVAKDICTEFCRYCVESGATFTITKNEIFALFEAGRNGPSIRREYNVSMGTVFNWRQAYRASLLH